MTVPSAKTRAPEGVRSGRRIEIRGTVQGVGFRPWVHRLAHEEGLTGRVWNDVRGVTVEVFGAEDVVDRFVARLRNEAPAAARIRDLRWTPIEAEATGEFVIASSGAEGERVLAIPPDIATCPECLAEVLDPGDRRYRYPFTNCTACGPRFTIAEDIPYDRPKTTMGAFEMCPTCRREYGDVHDRRFHAQPNACPECGPTLRLVGPSGEAEGDPIAETAQLLLGGAIVAIKGLGGFHLACDATSDAVVQALRERKHRDEKPFAVMIADRRSALRVAYVTPEEMAILTAPERPIVLVNSRDEIPVAPSVAPGTDLLGLFLPYTPLHHLLLAEVGLPLVMTSANRSDEPICQSDAEALALLGDVADAVLTHDRAIATRCDDSVVRVLAGRPTLLRRSRGYVPRAVPLEASVEVPVLACGAHLKNTFCLARGDQAWLGPHVGDLETLEAERFHAEAIARMERLLDLTPEIVAHDMHPGYATTRYALERPERQKVAVQHHHAHVAAAMAEHGLEGPVLGVAYDGTGWGPDGTAWGGEVLFADYAAYRRVGTFRPVKLAGGAQAIRQPWRVALALLEDAFDGEPPLDRIPLFEAVPRGEVEVVRQMLQKDLNCPRARGVGRLFDGLGALGLAMPQASYEGQVATAWNLAAARSERGRYPFEILDEEGLLTVDPRPLVRQAALDLIAGEPPSAVSARFHRSLVVATAEVVRGAVHRLGKVPVVLTGGAFQNELLTGWLLRELRGDLQVYAHAQVPPNDGGIALGQVMVAAARCGVYLRGRHPGR